MGVAEEYQSTFTETTRAVTDCRATGHMKHATTLHTPFCKHRATIDVRLNHFPAMVAPHAEIPWQSGIILLEAARVGTFAAPVATDGAVQLRRGIAKECRKTALVTHGSTQITSCSQSQYIL